MKYAVSIILSIAIIFSLASCGVQPSDDNGNASTGKPADTRVEQNSRTAVVDDESGNTSIVVYEGVTSVIAGDEEFDLFAGSAADITVENGIVIDVQIYYSSSIPAQFNSGTPGKEKY